MLFVISVLFLIAALVAFFVLVTVNDRDAKAFTFIVCVGCGAAGILGIPTSCVQLIPTGHVGIPVVFGRVHNYYISEGVNLTNPFASFQKMNVQTQNYWMSHVQHEGQNNRSDAVVVRSSDGLQMPVDISVPYRLLEDGAGWVFQNLGDEYVEKIIRPALSTATRRAASKYTAEQLYSTKLDEFTNAINPFLEEEIHNILAGYSSSPKKVFAFSSVLVGLIQIPDGVKAAIESKLRADQEQQAMEFKIMREKKDAERKRVEADGIQKFQEIVKKGIDPQLLQWKAIEATLELAKSPNSKIVIIGSGKDGLPVILGAGETK